MASFLAERKLPSGGYKIPPQPASQARRVVQGGEFKNAQTPGQKVKGYKGKAQEPKDYVMPVRQVRTRQHSMKQAVSENRPNATTHRAVMK